MNTTVPLSRRQKTALQQADNDLLKVLSEPAGRRQLMRMIDQTGVFARSFTGDTETFYREGRRSVGLDLVEHIERVQPGAFAKLQAEALALRTQLDSIGQTGEQDGD